LYVDDYFLWLRALLLLARVFEAFSEIAMPIYEEKLISPLAVRFSQQRIRATFRDGLEVEASMRQITVEPGAGDYDIILKAPFPTIEIIRWSQNGRKKGGHEHWFSFDNRRLYCLQRVAAQYWPKRVGAAVEVMYADPGQIRKKLDSQTSGLSVSIGHAFATARQLDEWSWRSYVGQRAPPGSFVSQAEAFVQADDAKVSVHDLMDLPRSPHLLERLEQASGESHQQSCPSATAVVPDAAEAVGDKQPEATQAQDPCLSNLIAQLLNAEAPKDTLNAEAPKDTLRETCSKVVSGTEASPPEDNSLTGLIGQLLVLETEDNTKQHAESHANHSDDAVSTHLSECAESLDSDGSLSECNRLSPSARSCDSEQTSVKGEESSQQVSDSKDPATSSRVQLAACTKGSEKKATGEAAMKKQVSCKADENRSSKGSQKNKAALLAQQQMQMAQYNMSHYAARVQMAQAAQMAQWQYAQMAQWQHAAAQFQATQAASWHSI
jgi:hypothetical protein